MASNFAWIQALAYSIKRRPSDGAKYYLFIGQRFSRGSFGEIKVVRERVITDEIHFERIVHYLNAIDKKHQPFVPVVSRKNGASRIDFDRMESQPPEEIIQLALEYDRGPKAFAKISSTNQLPLRPFSCCSKDLKKQSFKLQPFYAAKAEQIAKKQNRTKSELYAHVAMQYIDALAAEKSIF